MVKKMKKIFKVILLLLTLVSCEAKSVSTPPMAKVYYHYKTIEPYLSLTFDDGPNKIQTIKVLDILSKYKPTGFAMKAIAYFLKAKKVFICSALAFVIDIIKK